MILEKNQLCIHNHMVSNANTNKKSVPSSDMCGDWCRKLQVGHVGLRAEHVRIIEIIIKASTNSEWVIRLYELKTLVYNMSKQRNNVSTWCRIKLRPDGRQINHIWIGIYKVSWSNGIFMFFHMHLSCLPTTSNWTIIKTRVGTCCRLKSSTRW